MAEKHTATQRSAGAFLHYSVLGSFAFVVALAVLIWSTHGAGHPDPADSRRPTGQLAHRAATDRANAVTRLTLLCLDSLTRSARSDAIKSCSLAIALDPQNVTALNLRGNAYRFEGRNADAVADFTQAIHLSPGSADSYRFRAETYAALGQDRLALTDYARAITLAPNESISIELRGHYFQARGNYTSAVADFSKVIAMQPTLARAWNSRCWTRVLANTAPLQALADCNKSVQLDPANANAWDSRGFVLLRMNKPRSSIRSFNIALKLKPKLASALYGRGLAKLLLHDASAPRDIALAKRIDSGIEGRFRSYGIVIRVNGPPGT